jgi:hypothetical protein
MLRLQRIHSFLRYILTCLFFWQSDGFSGDLQKQHIPGIEQSNLSTDCVDKPRGVNRNR